MFVIIIIINLGNVACWNNDFYDEKRALEVDLITLKAMEEYEKKLKNKNKKNCLQ